MFNYSTAYHVRVEFRDSQPPLCDSVREHSKVEYTLESAVTGVNRKTTLFKVQVREEQGPYDC